MTGWRGQRIRQLVNGGAFPTSFTFLSTFVTSNFRLNNITTLLECPSKIDPKPTDL